MGDYHVIVSGDGIQTTESRLFEVDERKATQSQYITVRRIEDSGPQPVGSKSSMVSAAELNVSPKARKELDKANEAMARHDWKKALEHLNKAIAIDPHYAAAYNNLGVLYARMNDDAHEREALEKAISLDDHFAAPNVNLAKLCLREKNFPKAETLLEKAVSVDPNNAESLMLLADAQYMDSHYDAAIASAHEAHASSKTHPAFVHYIAARAYDKENRRVEALCRITDILNRGANWSARRLCACRHSFPATAERNRSACTSHEGITFLLRRRRSTAGLTRRASTSCQPCWPPETRESARSGRAAGSIARNRG